MTAADCRADLSCLDRLIRKGVSPFHTVQAASESLNAAGYKELPLNQAWNIVPGENYYINAYGSTLIAFRTGKDMIPGSAPYAPPLRIAAAHTDWPCMKIKPSPEMTSKGYAKLNAEAYGGPILNTWLDRPLSLAGRVSLAGADPFAPQSRLVDFEKPLALIPNLPLHFNRQVNDGVGLNVQRDMLPMLGLLDKASDSENFFLDLLAEKLSCRPEDILGYEFCAYNCDTPLLLGMNGEFYSAPRLDNLTSAAACLEGLLDASESGGLRMIALYDNEEIGSQTKQGAASPLMEKVLEKLYLSLGYDRQSYLNALLQGFFLSLDVAHAYHPNRSEVYDPKNVILPGDGVAIKISSSQSYATDAAALAVIEGLCRLHQIPCKAFSNRSDIRGGSTLGSISSCRLNMRTVDIGVPILAMHSARETMGAADQKSITELTKAYFSQ